MSAPASWRGWPASALSPQQRASAWERLGAEQFDVVVIGGGVVGSGCALDAATRGLRVAMVEARDFASGTSSRSSKMFHGGCATSSNSNSVWCVRRCTSASCP
ncbi:pyridine nucleotide-disulfide oxidoreductase family protein [Mycobacterium xenopi 4042]|uniref:Glycerol-3-phosphate dehydrogenase n=1 Tax=Mycobacterium xenopi 4042 TaxID=1299334 RepID=X7YLC3_MYCXE|nr:pyridine nucleotide-disulfide oxidoreductase family protein [Mycobacterium xenopi 4042]EUA19330.1 pyridine nucleotide-disulfide oxidoreductase family protein [Mycobacterium xenopi 3993]